MTDDLHMFDHYSYYCLDQIYWMYCMYADDVILLSGSVVKLQKLLGIVTVMAWIYMLCLMLKVITICSW